VALADAGAHEELGVLLVPLQRRRVLAGTALTDELYYVNSLFICYLVAILQDKQTTQML
jgi:hypothetical protein